MDGDRNARRYPKPTAGERAEKRIGPAKDKDSHGSDGAKADNTESKTNDGNASGDAFARHLTERQALHKNHEDAFKSMHERHHAEHKEMNDRHKKDGKDGKAHEEERHMMHHRHHKERHDMHGQHGGEHMDMAHRQAKELAAMGNATGEGTPAPATAAGARPDVQGPNQGQGAIPSLSPAPAA